MRFSRTNMRLAAARCRSLSRDIRVQTAEFSITDFCRRNLGPIKSGTYAPKIAKIGPALFNLSEALPARSFFCKVAEPDVTHVARPSACTFVTRPSWLERPREKASAPTKKKRPVPHCNTFQPRTVRGRRQSSFSLLPWPRRRAILTGFPFGLSGAGQRCGDGCRSRPGG